MTAGAQWNVDGGAWQDSGVPVCGLIAGSHTVNYKVIPGWVAPVSEAISISCSITTQISRTYNTQSTNKLPDTGQSKCYNASGEIPVLQQGKHSMGRIASTSKHAVLYKTRCYWQRVARFSPNMGNGAGKLDRSDMGKQDR